MDTTTQQPESEQRLKLIEDTISNARKSFNKGSFHYLLWGWLLIGAGITHYLLMQMGNPYFFLPWPIIGPIGGIIAFFYERQGIEKAGKKDPMDRVFGFIWGSFVVTLILVIVATLTHKTDPTPHIILLTGLPTFLSGGLIRSKALLFGGVIFWTIGLLAFFIPDQYSTLLFSGSLVFGYLIPGYILRSEEKNNA